VVSAKRLISSALVALAALGVQTVCAAPVRSTQVARALRCCSTRCHPARSAGAAGDCCVVDARAGDVVTAPPARVVDGGPVVHATPVALEALPDASVSAAVADASLAGRARGAPLFLLAHSLRL
jgi:hypothetical protein